MLQSEVGSQQSIPYVAAISHEQWASRLEQLAARERLLISDDGSDMAVQRYVRIHIGYCDIKMGVFWQKIHARTPSHDEQWLMRLEQLAERERQRYMFIFF